jgi:phospholipase/carboxylesterase
MSPLLDCVILEPRGGDALRSVIWLHGLGADGHDFEPIVPHLGLDPKLRVRFIFPHAPKIPVTLNMGLVMRAWYDIREMDLKNRHDEAGIRRSSGQIEDLIAHEKEQGIPASRIVLAGFSQGGAVALHTGLRHPETLAGIMALSSYLVMEDRFDAERVAANQETPIFQGHGEYDPMVRFERGEACRDRLLKLGYSVQWQSYPMEHAVHPLEIQHIGIWLGKVLASD